MYPDCFLHVTALAKHITMKICTKYIKRNKPANTATCPKARKPQAGAALAASSYPQLNVSSDGQVTSRAVHLGGHGHCLHAQDQDTGCAGLPKLHNVATSLESTPRAVPGVSMVLSCSWGSAAYSHAVQQVRRHRSPWVSFAMQECTSAQGHLAPLLSPPFALSLNLARAEFPLLLFF